MIISGYDDLFWQIYFDFIELNTNILKKRNDHSKRIALKFSSVHIEVFIHLIRCTIKECFTCH